MRRRRSRGRRTMPRRRSMRGRKARRRNGVGPLRIGYRF